MRSCSLTRETKLEITFNSDCACHDRVPPSALTHAQTHTHKDFTLTLLTLSASQPNPFLWRHDQLMCLCVRSWLSSPVTLQPHATRIQSERVYSSELTASFHYRLTMERNYWFFLTKVDSINKLKLILLIFNYNCIIPTVRWWPFYILLQ